MSRTRTSLAKKSSDSNTKNLKAPKKHYYRPMYHRSNRSRPIPEKVPPPTTGQRLVFTRNIVSGVFEDSGSRVPPIDIAMPKEALMPFWQSLETIENYSTVKITQQASKRGKMGMATVCTFFIVFIVLGSIAVPWLLPIAFFLVVAAVILLFFWIQQDYYKQ